MPTAPATTKAAKLHPGRNADDRPSARAATEAEPQQPPTAFDGEPLRLAVEESIGTLLDLALARESIVFDIDRRDDLMSVEQRRRAVADLERIIGELASGLAMARINGKVEIAVELVEQPHRTQPVREDAGLRKAV
jgi:hypothetical protein